MVDVIDLEARAMDAKAAIVMILVETRLKKPDHEFVKLLEMVEKWTYESHEQHMKRIGQVLDLERRLANLSCFEMAELEKPEPEPLRYDRGTLRVLPKDESPETTPF